MPMLSRFLLVCFALLSPSVVLAAQTVDSDAVVLRQVAVALNTAPATLKPALPFANQTQPVDDLDLVEIIMSIEDELQIEIDDAALDHMAGGSGITALPRKLTIKMLQDVVKKALLKRGKAAQAKKKQ